MQRIFTFSLLLILNCVVSAQSSNQQTGSQPIIQTTRTKEDRFAQQLRDRASDTDPHLPSTDQNNRSQRNFTGNASYPVMPFTPEIKSLSENKLSNISSIKIIDVRFDQEKVGFLPVNNELQKKGYSVFGFNIAPNLSAWLKEAYFENKLQLDTTTNRQLLVVLKKFWFSNDVQKPYTVSNPPLRTTLHYHFELFSSIDIGYYPQRSISGEISTLYNKGLSYTHLTDSFLLILQKEMLYADYKNKETETNWQSPVDFNENYNKRMHIVSELENKPPGLYNSFEDLLKGTPGTDSIEINIKYNNYDVAPIYGCQLTAFKDGVHYPLNNSWGYYNGKILFINIGNGFFVRLYRTNDQYIFYHLKNIQQDRIKKDLLERIRIGDNDYLMLRDFTKAFAFTYQLDLDTGKLY
jgi:hypothetical protein